MRVVRIEARSSGVEREGHQAAWRRSAWPTLTASEYQA